jgi:ATP-binding cassette subfamily B protein
MLDGKDIRRIPLKTLRARIGFVPQNNFLFSDTIEHNIAYGGNGSPDPASVMHAASVAMLHEDVRDFPEQYKTMLGEKGINLSGGQKQRACIARAVARNPEILVLDDALSAVDTATEAMIFDALLQEKSETTLLLISHRISTVKNCDRIFVLSEGSIAEEGTHEDLLQLDGLYADLYHKQLLEDEILAIT